MCCSTVALVAAVVLGAAPAATFPDPRGDLRGGAGPDLTSVSVSHTRSTVTFRLRFAKAPPLGWSAGGSWTDMLLIGLDTPPRTLVRTPTGWLGADYYLGMHGVESTAVLLKTTPAAQGKVLARPKVTSRGRTLVVAVARATLGNPSWFEFALAAGREGGSDGVAGGSDQAPEHGAFHYRLRG